MILGWGGVEMGLIPFPPLPFQYSSLLPLTLQKELSEDVQVTHDAQQGSESPAQARKESEALKSQLEETGGAQGRM